MWVQLPPFPLDFHLNTEYTLNMETITFDITNIGWVLSLVLGGILYHKSLTMKMQEMRREVNEANRAMNDWMDENIESVRRRVSNVEKELDGLDPKTDPSSKSYYNSGA